MSRAGRLLLQDPRHQLAGPPCIGPTNWPHPVTGLQDRQRLQVTLGARCSASGSLRWRSLSTNAIRSGAAGRRPRVEFLYGRPDDMDAHGSQALGCTSDACWTSNGRAALSGSRFQREAAPPTTPSHFVGEHLFRTFKPLGIKPEFYWVSELYAAGKMDRYVKLALDRADRVRAIYLRVSHVERSSEWLPIQVNLRAVRQDRHHVRHRLGRLDGRATRASRTWCRGKGLRPRGSSLAAGRPGQAALEPGMGGQVGSARCHDRGAAARTSPLRPVRADRSDAISREVFEVEPPRNVSYEFPQRGRQEDVHVKRARASPRTPSPRSCRRSSSVFSSCGRAPTRSSSSTPKATDDPTPLRRVRPDRPRPPPGHEVKGELPADPRATLLLLAAGGPLRTWPRPPPHSGPPSRHLALLLQIPGVDIAERMEAEKGAPLTAMENGILNERNRPHPAPGSSPTLPRGRVWSFAPRNRPGGSSHPRREAEGLPRLTRRAAETETPRSGDAWQTLIFRVASDAGLASGAPSGHSMPPSLGRSNGPAARAWLLASLEPAFRSGAGSGLQRKGGGVAHGHVGAGRQGGGRESRKAPSGPPQCPGRRVRIGGGQRFSPKVHLLSNRQDRGDLGAKSLSTAPPRAMPG